MAIISTGLVVALGLILVSTVFLLPTGGISDHAAMLSFSIKDETNLPLWCEELSEILIEENVKATVFIAGRVADRHANCVSNLASNKNLDIGSSTYSHTPLLLDDYLAQLDDIQGGKRAVDEAGNIKSFLFKAPDAKTDENIFSLLNRSGILADFSYDDHYNKQYGDYYIWFNATSYQGADHDVNFFRKLPAARYPLIINFDNTDPTARIHELIQDLKDTRIELVNASQLTNMQLTVRRDVE